MSYDKFPDLIAEVSNSARTAMAAHILGGYTVDPEKERLAKDAVDNIAFEIICLTAEIDRLAAENAALREAARWIPVEDRLPEYGGRYNVVCRYGKQRWVDDGVWMPRDHTWYRQAPEVDEITGVVNSKVEVTHWKPLPEPPALNGGEA